MTPVDHIAARDSLLRRILAWAHARPDIAAVILTGSAARADGRLDEFSDLDVELVSPDPAVLERDDAWLAGLGDVMVCLPLANDPGPATRLVFYRDGIKVDFTLSDLARVRAMRTGLSPLYARGYRVLLDRAGVADGLPAPTGRPPARVLPGQAELDLVVAEFWFEAAHIPRLLLRDELWLVKHRDWTMKELLRRMLEWEAVARGGARGAPADVWHVGAHMRAWIEPDAWRDLHRAFGGFGRPESWAALLATTALFRRTARVVADTAGLAYAERTDAAVDAYVRSFADRVAPGG